MAFILEFESMATSHLGPQAESGEVVNREDHVDARGLHVVLGAEFPTLEVEDRQPGGHELCSLAAQLMLEPSDVSLPPSPPKSGETDRDPIVVDPVQPATPPQRSAPTERHGW